MRISRVTATAALATASLLLGTAPAHAADPPASWGNERVLTCDGTETLTYLTPAGFGTPFHVVGSTDVIKPVHVEVIFPGQSEPVTTFHTNGFDHNNLPTVHCTYTDPVGLFVMLEGQRT
jgi:hypothetical protein